MKIKCILFVALMFVGTHAQACEEQTCLLSFSEYLVTLENEAYPPFNASIDPDDSVLEKIDSDIQRYENILSTSQDILVKIDELESSVGTNKIIGQIVYGVKTGADIVSGVLGQQIKNSAAASEEVLKLWTQHFPAAISVVGDNFISEAAGFQGEMVVVRVFVPIIGTAGDIVEDLYMISVVSDTGNKILNELKISKGNQLNDIERAKRKLVDLYRTRNTIQEIKTKPVCEFGCRLSANNMIKNSGLIKNTEQLLQSSSDYIRHLDKKQTNKVINLILDQDTKISAVLKQNNATMEDIISKSRRAAKRNNIVSKLNLGLSVASTAIQINEYFQDDSLLDLVDFEVEFENEIDLNEDNLFDGQMNKLTPDEINKIKDMYPFFEEKSMEVQVPNTGITLKGVYRIGVKKDLTLK